MNIIKILTFCFVCVPIFYTGHKEQILHMILHVLLVCNSKNRMHKITQRGAETAASIIWHL